MKSLKMLGIAAGLAALAACGGTDEADMTNTDDLNAMTADNMMLPPVDMNADMNADLNADMNAINDTNMTVEPTDNTIVNGY